MSFTKTRSDEYTVFISRYNDVGMKVVDYDKDCQPPLDALMEDILFNSPNMLAGIAIHWDLCGTHEHRHHALLMFYTGLGCVLVKLRPGTTTNLQALQAFLGSKHARFAGVHIKNDVERLRKVYGLKVENLLELSELTSAVYGKPGLADGCGAKELALKVLNKNFHKPMPLPVSLCHQSLVQTQAEKAFWDVCAAYSVGEKTLELRCRQVKMRRIYGELCASKERKSFGVVKVSVLVVVAILLFASFVDHASLSKK